jgi:hypothetical protein
MNEMSEDNNKMSLEVNETEKTQDEPSTVMFDGDGDGESTQGLETKKKDEEVNVDVEKGAEEASEEVAVEAAVEAEGEEEVEEAETPPLGLCRRIWNRWWQFYFNNDFVIMIVIAILLAKAYPPLGADYLQPQITSTWIAVIFIFGTYNLCEELKKTRN